MLKQALLFVTLVGSLGVSAHASSDQWIEVRSSHFTVVTNSNEKQARLVIGQFERMRWMFQTLFPKADVDPAAPIVVVGAKNGKTFQAMEPAAYLAKGQIQLAGYFMNGQDKNYVLLRLDAEQEHPFATVYHEYTHLQFANDHDWMPLWLNEGLAEFMQNTEFRNKDVFLGEASVDDLLYLRQNRIIPLQVLFTVDSKSPYYHEEQKGSIFYAESWALTHFLFVTDKQKGTDRVGDYMRALVRRQDPVTAAQTAFGDLRVLQKQLEEYIGASSYKQFVLSSAAAIVDESAFKVRALTQNEADAVRADLLAGVGRKQEAKDLLDAILKADPNNAQAHETMGSLELRDGDRDAARKWYEEAVKLNSQNFLTYYFFASLSLSQGGTDGNKDIEQSLHTSIQLNPRFFPSYETLASLLMSQEKFREAKTVLEDSLKVKLKPSEVAVAKQRLNSIQQIQDARTEAASAQARQPEMNAISTVVDVVSQPKHPVESPNGPKHWAEGVIHNVQCSYPAEIEFQIEGTSKTVTVYGSNYSKLDVTAIGFTPTGSLNPCEGLQGMKARVRYAESSDKTVAGQVIAIELRK